MSKNLPGTRRSPPGSGLTAHGSKLKHECGVIGVFAPEAASLAVLGLNALQHRGQESAGVASFDGNMHLHKGMGLVGQVFHRPIPLPGAWAVGHNRYSTCGTSS